MGKRIRWLCQWYGGYRLRQRGYLDFLASRPPGAIFPDFADLWFLYKTVRRKRPNQILEFGSGFSTLVLAQAMWENQRHLLQSDLRLYSIEADAYWAQRTAELIPAHLRSLCEVWYSPLLEVEYEGTPAYRHAKIPDVVPDLIYLDGPALTPERQVAVDILDMEDKFRPGLSLIVDGRWTNTLFFRQHLKRRYVFKHRSIFRNSIFELVA